MKLAGTTVRINTAEIVLLDTNQTIGVNAPIENTDEAQMVTRVAATAIWRAEPSGSTASAASNRPESKTARTVTTPNHAEKIPNSAGT